MADKDIRVLKDKELEQVAGGRPGGVIINHWEEKRKCPKCRRIADIDIICYKYNKNLWMTCKACLSEWSEPDPRQVKKQGL